MHDTTTPDILPHPLLAEATALLPDIVALRRRLHRRPEIGLALPETQAAVADELRALGLEPILGTGVGSVAALIDGERPGPTMLLRADMDGLPLHEDTGLEFESELEGAMHACGHDTHVALLLGAARILLRQRDRLAGRVLLMFAARRGGLPRRPVHARGGAPPARGTVRGDRCLRDPHQHQVREEGLP